MGLSKRGQSPEDYFADLPIGTFFILASIILLSFFRGCSGEEYISLTEVKNEELASDFILDLNIPENILAEYYTSCNIQGLPKRKALTIREALSYYSYSRDKETGSGCDKSYFEKMIKDSIQFHVEKIYTDGLIYSLVIESSGEKKILVQNYPSDYSAMSRKELYSSRNEIIDYKGEFIEVFIEWGAAQ